MAIWRYPATVREEDGEYLVAFADIPEAITGGSSEAEAKAGAPDALAAAVEGWLAQGRSLPEPRSARAGEFEVPLDMGVAARAAIAQAMRDQNLTKSALAARMSRDEKVVRRILSGRQASLGLMSEALRALGMPAALAT